MSQDQDREAPQAEIHDEPATWTLADLRKQARLSQRQVADTMGITRSQVSRIEAQYPEVRLTQLQAYMKALGGNVHLIAGAFGNVPVDKVVTDASRREALQRRMADPHRQAKWSATAEELVLKGKEPEADGDPTGRFVDAADAVGDCGDERDGQQP